MNQLFRLSGSVKQAPAIENWMKAHTGELGAIAQRWFEVMRSRGDDVREVLHDGHPTACVADAAFAYVSVFKAHVNVGFFRGAEIADPKGLLEGTGKFMRHVKLRPGHHFDATALTKLVDAAYSDMKERVQATCDERTPTHRMKKRPTSGCTEPGDSASDPGQRASPVAHREPVASPKRQRTA